MIMIQQQVYPHFVGQAMTANSAAVIKREPSNANNGNGVAVCVIKETESVRNVNTNRSNERCRSVSPSEKSIKRSNSLAKLTSPSIITQIASKVPKMHKFDVQRFIKRSNSADYDDELFDGDAEDQIIKQSEQDRQYDSEPEGRDHDRLYDYSTRYTTDDDDLPLDLSLATERRRTRTYSDTESDDSAGTGEEKATGKAAYKKSLMKRYRKYRLYVCCAMFFLFPL